LIGNIVFMDTQRLQSMLQASERRGRRQGYCEGARDASRVLGVTRGA
jgi:hypothetical protein